MKCTTHKCLWRPAEIYSSQLTSTNADNRLWLCGMDDIQFGRELPVFQRMLLPPYPEMDVLLSVPGLFRLLMEY
jgi:hypothetical protein